MADRLLSNIAPSPLNMRKQQLIQHHSRVYTYTRYGVNKVLPRVDKVLVRGYSVSQPGFPAVLSSSTSSPGIPVSSTGEVPRTLSIPTS